MTSQLNISCAPQTTIGEVVDSYILMRGVQRKKNYLSYLYAAHRAWKDIFQNVIWATSSKWMPIRYGTPYNYVELPKGSVRVFSANVLDDCGNIVRLFYNSQINVIEKPLEEACNRDCGCSGGICDDVNSMTMTKKLMFTIGGVDYYEKKWAKYCKNGDVIEYTETPTKKYNDMVGNGGDFNEDYNDDYLIGNPNVFDNMEIVYVRTQKIVCKLKVKPCGCPEDNQDNTDAFYSACGCYMAACDSKCKPIYQNINDNKFGEVNISECGTKLFYRNPSGYSAFKDGKAPSHLLIVFQVSGDNVSGEIVVPDGAQKCMWAGIDYYTKAFNSKYSWVERRELKWNWEDEQIKYTGYLNPVRLSFLYDVQNADIKW